MPTEIPMGDNPYVPGSIPSADQLTIAQAIASANAAKNAALEALADIPAAIDAEVGPAVAPYISQAEGARDASVAAKTAAEAARDNALASERRIRQQSLGTFANDAAAVAWAAAQSPAITIITGTSYLNSTTDIFRYAVVTAGPTITWHDVTEDEAAQAALATASATAAQNALSDLLTRYVGPFNSTPTYVGDTAPWSVGALYWNRLQGKFFVWNGSGWDATDATTVAAALAASDSASAAAASAATASGAAGTATTQAGLAAAAKIASESARDAAAGSATAAANSNSAVQAALLQSISYAALAQAGAATVSATSGLQILAAAQRAVALMTDGAASFIWDVRRDSDAGAWVDKGTLKPPKMMLLVGRTTASSALTVYDLTDPTVPAFLTFDASAGNTVVYGGYAPTSIFALNGMIYFAQPGATTGLGIIDLITGKLSRITTSTTVWPGGLANRTSTTTYVESSVGIANNVVNSIAATILPNTPLNPARCNLPNPTVAVATASAVSTIRADGVVVNDSFGATFTSVAFDLPGPGQTPNLWSLQSTGAVYVSSQYLSASWVINNVVSFTAAQLGIGTATKIVGIGPNMVAIAGPSGLARIKLDPANPAQSLVNIKTTTYDAGWQVLGKTVLAMAESSGDLSTITAAQPLNDDFSSYADTAAAQAVWLPSAGGSCALSGSGASGALLVTGAGATTTGVARAFTTIIGAAYRMQFDMTLGTAASVDVTCTNSQTGGAVLANPLGGSSYNLFSSSGTKTGQWFVATATTTWFQFMPRGNGLTATLDNVRIDRIAYDKSGSGNHLLAVGAPTRAVVASGADTAGVGGLSSSNFLQGTPGAIALGSGDCAFLAWVNPTSVAGSASIITLCDPGGTGALVRLRMSGGAPYITANDGTNGYTATTGAFVANIWAMVVGVRRGQTLELYQNDRKLTSVSATSLGSLTNALATLYVGAGIINSGDPFPGAIALPRVFNYAPTPDQIAFIFEDEKARFNANAQSLLTGANVQGVAWDPDTEQLAAPNSTGGCDVFKGSVRVANDNSATGSTNLFKGSSLPAGWTLYANSALGSKVTGPASWGGGEAWALNDNATSNGHYVQQAAFTAADAQAYTIAWPVQAAAKGYATLQLGSAYALFNLSTGVGSGAAGGATINSSVNLGNGWWLLSITATPSAGAVNAVLYADISNGTTVYLGTGVAAINFGKPMIVSGSTVPAGYFDALSGSANAKAAAFAGGKLAVVTAAGVDVWIPSADGLRAINDAVGSSKRPFYDPTWGQYFGVTTDATPTVFAAIPIPEGKAFRFRATVAAIQWGGTATEKAVYDITGVVSRDIGGNVVVVSTTTTISEVTSSMDCIAQANTTAQTLEIKGTGKASTRIAWFDGQELYDVGLQAAA